MCCESKYIQACIQHAVGDIHVWGGGGQCTHGVRQIRKTHLTHGVVRYMVGLYPRGLFLCGARWLVGHIWESGAKQMV